VWMPDKVRFVVDWLIDNIVKSVKAKDRRPSPGEVPFVHSGFWSTLAGAVIDLPPSCTIGNVTDAVVAVIDLPTCGLLIYSDRA